MTTAPQSLDGVPGIYSIAWSWTPFLYLSEHAVIQLDGEDAVVETIGLSIAMPSISTSDDLAEETPVDGSESLDVMEMPTLSVIAGLNFLLSYDGNDETSGEIPAAPTRYIDGTEITVLGRNTLAKSGYSFDDWNTAADGSGTTYADTDTFNISANTTLYAQWV